MVQTYLRVFRYMALAGIVVVVIVYGALKCTQTEEATQPTQQQHTEN